MAHKIYKWSELSSYYSRGTLLLGNGASIAIDPNFGYSSLIDYASENNFLTEDVSLLFKFFETNDFELVLRLVWQASNVNKSLGVPDDKTHKAYLRVRDCLIKSVRGIHPQHHEVSIYLEPIYNFIKNFDTVISLNYDLILYWASMYGNGIYDQHTIKDCFIYGVFKNDWGWLRGQLNYDKTTTLVFYPHGNLILVRDKVESEFKLTTRDVCLLNEILDAWASEEYIPLFVCEGNSQQKIKSIEGSHYLSVIYREVYQNIGEKLVIYGWGLGKQDEYILKRIVKSSVKSIAVSVYGNDQAYCNHVISAIHQVINPSRVKVEFFASDSPGCWNNFD
ncbi:DUF4917 family protein [Klebsiella pneumoniae]|uniref:DUF4917 family protein n=1 Tax=Klebsiella TaxID=570 RepID=UPI00114460B1|nr:MULTISPECIES: DUF4917 family protein [Klebsiella]HDU3942448.1 DUF4917 family protein [Klebsiella pneumoniae subsp. pneumoniae]MDC6731921.1 DUF4917 family protein [Klebsiella pneumoniae]MDR4714479.1 DUF4917 family protein [Klebsiella pneumoniae]TQD21474.1 DUF4917 family protein [Klebsiella quasipneumoniae]BBK11069.1 DUF4917 domain-containing protein [Klebsiella quasipneumoniae]